MPYEVTYDSKRNCIVTRIDGKLDIPVIKEFLAEIARVIAASGCQRILDDLREAELTPSMGEFYIALRLVSEVGIPRTTKSAIVVPEKDWSLYSYLEVVAQHKGQVLRMFTDPEEASRWLMAPSAGLVVDVRGARAGAGERDA